MKRSAGILFFLLCLFTGYATSAQNDSCDLRISVLTCAPGEELYSLFGHSALRVTDSSRGSDSVFNYGTCDFTDPDCYMKFVKGQMDFFVSVEAYSDFIQTYQVEQRSVVEQTLNLSCAEKATLLSPCGSAVTHFKGLRQFVWQPYRPQRAHRPRRVGKAFGLAKP